MSAESFLAQLPQRHRDEWARTHEAQLRRGATEEEARQEAWRSIGFAKVWVDGRLVPVVGPGAGAARGPRDG